jgi:hypothetical protein
VIYKEFRYAGPSPDSTYTNEYWDFSRFMLEAVLPTLDRDTSDLQTVRVWSYSALTMPMFDVLTEKIGFEPLSIISIATGKVNDVHPSKYIDIVFITPYSISALI